MITAQVKGRSADHFRAYAKTKLTRRPNLEDHRKRADAGKEPFANNARVRHSVEEAVIEGPVTLADAVFTLDAGEQTISRVVFFNGTGDESQVVGAVDVNSPGKIEIELVEPKDPNAPEVFDEEA